MFSRSGQDLVIMAIFCLNLVAGQAPLTDLHMSNEWLWGFYLSMTHHCLPWAFVIAWLSTFGALSAHGAHPIPAKDMYGSRSPIPQQDWIQTQRKAAWLCIICWATAGSSRPCRSASPTYIGKQRYRFLWSWLSTSGEWSFLLCSGIAIIPKKSIIQPWMPKSRGQSAKEGSLQAHYFPKSYCLNKIHAGSSTHHLIQTQCYLHLEKPALSLCWGNEMVKPERPLLWGSFGGWLCASCRPHNANHMAKTSINMFRTITNQATQICPWY